MQNIIDKESLAAVDKIIFFPSSWRFALYVGIQEMQFPEGSSYTCNLGTNKAESPQCNPAAKNAVLLMLEIATGRRFIRPNKSELVWIAAS